MTGKPTPREPSGGFAIGRTVGSYVIESLLGRGGMAVVFVARHRELDKRVAIKVLKSELAENEEIRKRFLREGRAAARVHHPHVVDITDVGSDGDDVYLVMELLEGETLSAVLEREVILAPERIIDYLVPVVAALGAAHKRGVVHRDLKPENVFLARDPSGRAFPKVLDFGISSITDTASDERVTEVGSVLGTPHYMSPEQARGDFDIDPRSDQFSLAIILYEALVGRLPYDGETAVQLIHEVARGDVPPLRAFKSWIPVDLEAVAMRALSSEREQRYETIEELGLALLPFASERTADAWRDALMGQAKSPSLPPASPGPVSTGRRNRAEMATTPQHRRSGQTTGDAAVKAPSLAMPPLEPIASADAPRRSGRAWALIALLVVVLGGISVAYVVGGTASPATTHALLHLSPSATVLLDDVVVGSGTVVSLSFPDDDAPHRVVVRADGSRDFEATVTRASELPSDIVLTSLVAVATAVPDAGAELVEVDAAEPAADEPPATTVRARPRRPPSTGRGDSPPHTSAGPEDDLRISR